MYKIILPLSLLLLLLFSCNTSIKNQITTKYEAPISPQNMKFELDLIRLEDFVNNTNNIDSVLIEGHKVGFYQSKKQIIFESTYYKNPLTLMQIWIKGKSTDVLLQNSRKHYYLFSFDPKGIKYDSVQIAGEINGWTPSKTKLEWHNNAWQQMLVLEDGKYQYQIVANGKWMIDNSNPVTAPNGQGGTNSVMVVGDSKNKKPILKTLSYTNDEIQFSSENSPEKIFVFWNNKLIPYSVSNGKMDTYKLTIPKIAKEYPLSYIRVFSYNKLGTSNQILIPLVNGKVAESSKELPRTAKHTNIIYNVFVDRFFDGDSTNNKPLPDSIVLPQANYNGGDMKGIIEKINQGYFKNLGVNSLWLSPLVKNTEGAYGYWPNPKTKFSAYHGYWPTSFTQLNPHFGDENDLNKLVKTAHNNNENIFLDMVANHVHKEHPYYKEHPDYVTQLKLPDGRLNLELWDEYRLTTWFDKFLPTLDLEREEVAEMLADSITWWAKEYNIDGFRYDAAKHIPLTFWRRLTKELKDSVINNGQQIYQLGETYGSSELIDSYISNGLLDAQFDFNVYDAALGVFAGGNNMKTLAERLEESLKVYGSHNLMAYITGNQDRGRFISYAGGDLKFDEDAKAAGWNRDIEVGNNIGYKKLQMLMAFNMTIPGIPVIYYGDEFGMPGGNDPDCRRMMRFDNELNKLEKNNLEITKKLTKLRSSNMALLYGDFNISSDTNSMYYTRQYFDIFVWVGFNNSDKEKRFKLASTDVNSKSLKANFNGEIENEGDDYFVIIPANSFEIITNNK